MTNSTQLYHQLLNFRRQYSRTNDLQMKLLACKPSGKRNDVTGQPLQDFVLNLVTADGTTLYTFLPAVGSFVKFWALADHHQTKLWITST